MPIGELLALGKVRLDALVAVVDEVLEAVENALTGELEIADNAESFLLVAYSRAWRCVRATRALAAWPTCDADNAFVLTRALLSMVARSLSIVAPEDLAERASRFHQWQFSSALERKKLLKDWARLGFDPTPEAIEQVEGAIARMRADGIRELPPEQQLLAQLGLEPFYARAYGSRWQRVAIGLAEN